MPGLTKLQKASLSQLAAKAYHALESLDLIDRPSGVSHSAHLTTWRRAEIQKACGIPGLTSALQKHYLPIRAHFLQLCGDDGAAFEAHMKMSRVKDHGSARDTHTSRAEVKHLINSALTSHASRAVTCPIIAAKGGAITPAYIEAIAKSQFKITNLNNLTTAQLTKLLYTVNNRIAAREGRGSSSNRNKSQRLKK